MAPALGTLVQLELGSLRTQVEVLSVDKAMLEDRLEASAARLAETQAALNNATRDLAGLQVRMG